MLTLERPYVIYTSYINIFQRGQIGALFIWLKFEWHTSIANHLKKEYTTGDCRHLCTFSVETHRINVNAGKAFQLDQSREGVYIHVNTGRHKHTA